LIVLFLWRAGIWGGDGLLLHYSWMWISEVLIGSVAVALVATRTLWKGAADIL
jgi:hypothetical protein